MHKKNTRPKRSPASTKARGASVRYVALLRGINLGKRRPPMTELKALFEELGFEDVATFIASGNVVFASQSSNAAALETQIEKHLASSLGYEVSTFVRRADEIIAVANTKAFREQDQAGMTVHVCFMREPLAPALARALENIRTELDAFRVIGREFYWLCRSPKSTDSKVWDEPEMKKLKLPVGTMRNMTSIRKLIAKHLAAEDA